MKKELFEYSKEEASAYMNSDGIKELDYVETEDYKLFGEGLSNPVKLRAYGDRSFVLEIVVPEELQCVPCELTYKTKNLDGCPCCGTANRDVMLRNKVHEEPFRRFEGIYSELLNAALRTAQPVCALISDNFTEDQARDAYAVAYQDYLDTLDALKPFNFIFEPGIMDKIVEMKKNEVNVKVMKELMGDDASEQALLDFSK
jgi:hypothetical protein